MQSDEVDASSFTKPTAELAAVAITSAASCKLYRGWQYSIATPLVSTGGILRGRASVTRLRYLADDDHGPLALQEILLAGCPTVGVRTGASFVKTGETGVVVDRLPPGRQCVESDDDARALAVFMEAIERAQTMSRKSGNALLKNSAPVASLTPSLRHWPTWRRESRCR